MPKVLLTADARRRDIFARCYRMGKAIMGQTDDDVAKSLGLNRNVLLEQKKDPMDRNKGLRLGTWVQLAVTWPDEDIIAFVRGK